MYCRYCMKKIDDNDKKCKSCGKDLTPIDSKEMKYCKYCYTYNQKDAKYCYKCSADLPDKTITKRNNSSIVIGIVISTLVYFLIYKLTNMKLVDDTVEGMGFAIPIEDALKVADILEKEGKVTRPYIGISMLDLTNSFYLWQAGILLPDDIHEGVAIYKVENNSPAKEAGLQKGDIITKLAGKSTKSLAEFRFELYKHSPGDEIEVTYYRNGKEQKTKIKLGKGE